jgi:hypothetical protein
MVSGAMRGVPAVMPGEFYSAVATCTCTYFLRPRSAVSPSRALPLDTMPPLRVTMGWWTAL